MPRVIVLITKNSHKKQEFEKQFKRYGHELVIDYDLEHRNDLSYYVTKYQEIAKENEDYVLVAVMRERMELLDGESNLITNDEIDLNYQLLPVTNRSTLSYMSFRDKFTDVHTFEHCTKGYIDYRKRHLREPMDRKLNLSGKIDADGNLEECEEVFGWDDVFTDLMTHHTYLELQHERDINNSERTKISSRDHVISKFIEKVIYYNRKIDLFHNPQNFKSVVDFDQFESVLQTVQKILMIGENTPKRTEGHNHESELAKDDINTSQNKNYLKQIVQNICYKVFNSGITFRAPENRRVKLNWMPGLNPGIPFTRKIKDPGQEATYMIHDFGHHIIPDLMFIKKSDNPLVNLLYKRVYIMYRLMSEAITMIIADMFYVDSILEGGKRYADVGSRRIYPLYLEILKNNSDKLDDLEKFRRLVKEIIRANVHYVLTGKSDHYSALLNKRDEESEVLKSFKTKYESFFVEDYRWTANNYKFLEDVDMSEWFDELESLGLFDGMNLITIEEFCNHTTDRFPTFSEDVIKEGSDFDPTDLVDPIFESIYDIWLQNPFDPNNVIALVDEDVRREKSFRRYMLGQMVVFYRMVENYPEDKMNAIMFKNNIFERLLSFKRENKLDLKSVNRVRSFYNLYLSGLLDRGIITSDDFRVYAEVYPILEPFIVSYQEPGENLRDRLVDFSRECLK